MLLTLQLLSQLVLFLFLVAYYSAHPSARKLTTPSREHGSALTFAQ